jgi:hypothetical protein
MYRRDFEFGSAVECSLDDVVYRLDYSFDLDNAGLAANLTTGVGLIYFRGTIDRCRVRLQAPDSHPLR